MPAGVTRIGPSSLTLIFAGGDQPASSASAGLPSATVAAAPLTALVVYGWVLAGCLAGRPRATVCAAVSGLALCIAPGEPAPIDPTGLRAHVVETIENAEPVPEWAQIVVVLEGGPPRGRPVATREGIPVIFPNDRT